jgi:hypothetical protein
MLPDVTGVCGQLVNRDCTGPTTRLRTSPTNMYPVDQSRLPTRWEKTSFVSASIAA